MKEKIKHWLELTGVPSEKLLKDMILSEFDELVTATRENDIVEVFDAIVDIEYLNLQYVVRARGIAGSVGSNTNAYFANARAIKGLLCANDLQMIWDCLQYGLLAVHKSNMSKLCLTHSDALKTCNEYGQDGVECSINESHGLFIVRRTSDKKIMKCVVNYKSPTDDLRKILIGAGVIKNGIS